MEETKKKPESVRYLVETKGYKETFESLSKAHAQFEVLKKRAIKNKESIKIKLSEKKSGKTNLIDELSINESFFD